MNQSQICQITFPGSERLRAQWVAEVPQPLHLSRDSPGQPGGIQKGKYEPSPTVGSHYRTLPVSLNTCADTKTQCLCVIVQFQMEAEQLSETLHKLNSSLDPKSVSQKNNSETLLQLEVRSNFSNQSQRQKPKLSWWRVIRKKSVYKR